MGIREYIDGLMIVDEMCRTWGESIEDLNQSERLWLIRCGLGSMCDFNAAKHGLDEDIAAAENALIHLGDRDFYLNITYAFCQYLGDGSKPLGYYLSSPEKDEQEWVDTAIETWGENLENIPENDGLIFLFNVSTEPIDFDDLPNLDDMHEWLEAFKEIREEDQGRLLAGIASHLW